jgi:hypothetical protein
MTCITYAEYLWKYVVQNRSNTNVTKSNSESKTKLKIRQLKFISQNYSNHNKYLVRHFSMRRSFFFSLSLGLTPA